MSLPAHLPSLDIPSMEALFDALTDVAFFVKDREGRYLGINDTMVRRCGRRSKRELLGKNALDLFPRPLAQAYMAQDRQVIDTGIALQRHLELHMYPGRSRGWCLTSKTPLRDAHGTIIGLVGTSQDLGAPDEIHPEYRQIADIATHIRERYHEDISLQGLADGAGLSISRMERLFRRVFHHSPRQMLVQARLNAALERLAARPSDSIAAIAYACGYTDHSAFSRQFKAQTGMSPAEYRTTLTS